MNANCNQYIIYIGHNSRVWPFQLRISSNPKLNMKSVPQIQHILWLWDCMFFKITLFVWSWKTKPSETHYHKNCHVHENFIRSEFVNIFCNEFQICFGASFEWDLRFKSARTWESHAVLRHVTYVFIVSFIKTQAF